MTRKQQRHLRGHPPAVQDNQVNDHSPCCLLQPPPTREQRAARTGARDQQQPWQRGRRGSRRKNPAGPESHFLLLLQQAAGMTRNRALESQGASVGAAASSSSSICRAVTLHLCASRCWQHFGSNKMDTLGSLHIFQNSDSFPTSTENSVSMNFTCLEDLPSTNTSYIPNSHIPVVI